MELSSYIRGAQTHMIERTEWLTTEQAGEMLEYDQSQVRRLIKSGKIKGQKFGRDWMVDKSSLLEFKSQVQSQPKKRGRRKAK